MSVWILVAISLIIVLFVIISNNQTRESSSNNQSKATQSSTNASSRNIQWTELSTNQTTTSTTFGQSAHATVNNDFLNGINQDLDIDKLVKNLIGQKDRVSGEVFCQGEKVYFCVGCQLGYHEDSWEFLNQRCEQCKSSNVKIYSLPLISLREIKLNTTTNNFSINADHFLYCGLDEAKRGDYKAAILNFSESVRHNPTNANTYNERGIAHYELGNIQAAIADYTQALRINPNHTHAKKNLDLARSRLKDTHKAGYSTSSNSRTSAATEVYEKCISALDLNALCRNIGQTISVKGRIRNVRVENNIIYFDFTENQYEGFYAYVVANSGHYFPNATTYSGKNVVVHGMISFNKRKKPRMILKEPSQLRDAEQ